MTKSGGIFSITLSQLGQAPGGEEVVDGISRVAARKATQDSPTTKTHQAPNVTVAGLGSSGEQHPHWGIVLCGWQ